MIDGTLLDPMGAVIRELRLDADVAALVHGRVRGAEPGPGDARGVGSYQAFIVVVAFEDYPHPTVPILQNLYGVNCYGSTYQNAREVWAAVVKALHVARARLATGGLGIYISIVVDGGDADADPVTQQPVVRGTIRVVTTAQAML